MAGYSHSQIHTYLTCPLKYRYDKIDRLGKQTKESSLALILGSAVHAAFEFLYKQRTNLRTPDLEAVIQRYKMSFLQECDETTTEFLPEEQEVFMDRGLIYLEWYRSTYYPFDQAITMAVEESFSFKLDEHISFSGYIDRLDILDETMIIIDYKTSKRLEPDDADSHQEQINLYAAGLQQKYGKKFTTFIGKLIYVHLQKEVVRTISTEQIENIRLHYLGNAQLIEVAKERLAQYPNDETIFPPVVGSHCTYCPFQMICPQWKHQYMDDEIVSSDLGDTTIKKLVDTYSVLSKNIYQLTKEKKTITQILVSYAQEKSLKTLIGNEWKTNVFSRTYRSVQSDQEKNLRAYLKEKDLLEGLLKTDTNALAKLIDKQVPLTDIQSRVRAKKSARLGPASKKRM